MLLWHRDAWGDVRRGPFLPPNPGAISWFLNAAIDAFSIITHVKAAVKSTKTPINFLQSTRIFLRKCIWG